MSYKIIISGGGTGGHIFPALSIANEIRRRFPDADILFIGAEGRMEMERVPAAGYNIAGLPVSGLNRTDKLKNISVILKFVKSLIMARKYIRKFKPDIVIGVGGYASAPTSWMASLMKIPVLIQEQNSYAGVTNKMLGKIAAKICVSYRGMEKFFPPEKIALTGNPVRKDLETAREKDAEALGYFGLEGDKPTLLIIGGSLGARTINKGVRRGLKLLTDAGVQIIWQTGRYYFETIQEDLKDTDYGGLWFNDFISRMDYAYSVADLVVSRAGAGTISELCILKKAVILVPSPNVAEDHQMKNARALSDNDAAVLIPDVEAEERLAPVALELLGDKKKIRSLSENIALFAQYDSAERIVNEVVEIIES
ncbi:MAG: undecaprenyldiphospho-muramoylpentapeptide beta-N-acetylglucosaminyltransferase [Tannerella sp.]|jgi:UDP-N-acetylglucosamine--N-acetylmuramyl-(pentapeptide) pyrophosphoryl-undecaprenol N-acetylglucosamine transferase|nr:undecaprenyldiphospho-muramoylpentapeptide beta-N-acetylglucosaminyltransferase [Tannerella sp.]